MGAGAGAAGAGELMYARVPETAAAAPAPAAAPASAPVAVEELYDRGAIFALRDEWERLAADVAAAGGVRGPFLTPEWLGIFAAALADARAPGCVGELRLLVAHRAGRLVAALPLVVESRLLAGVPARLLRSLADDHSQRFDLLLAPGADGDEAAHALARHLARARGWDALELRSVPTDGSNGARLVAAAATLGMVSGTWPAMRSPYLPLPASVDELDRQLSAKFRGNLRRRANKLAAAQGALSLERIDGGSSLDAALDEGFSLEAAGWKGELGTAIACDAGLRARYGALAHAFAARGQLACYFLRAGTRRIAFHFALVDGDTYYLLKPGFDPALANFGPGHLLVDAVARDLIGRGVRELDFLGDDMPWKREWTSVVRSHNFVYLFAPSLRGRALARWKLRLAPALKDAVMRAQLAAERLRARAPRSR
jgi:CelD/BcsL family acetyltransferase involved in cellulose biosynthesis